MRIVHINSVLHGSTGGIMNQLALKTRENGNISYVSAPKGRHFRANRVNNCLFIGGRWEEDLHILLGRMTGLQGVFSVFSTYRFLKKLSEIDPMILHLHNLHNSYINLPMLFAYIKKHNINVVWTLHDCWSFTGHCPHFDMVCCNKWEYGCDKCALYHEYPQSWIDNSKYMYQLKKKWFRNVENMTLVTPSEWLASMVKKSFLKDYNVEVINNGINLSVFKPTRSNYKVENNFKEKKIVLGVAFGWCEKKGLDVFINLAGRLDKKYQIVLVGTDDSLDEIIPDNIIKIRQTSNQEELVKIYSCANVFVNPTREETFGLVNIEALACGTPVVTFDTGGSPECIDDTCGIIIKKNDIDALEKAIEYVCFNRPFTKEACVSRAMEFDMNIKGKEYMDLYERIITTRIERN